MDAFIARRLPLTGSIIDLEAQFRHRPVTLAAITESLAEARTLPAAKRKAELELSLHHTLAHTCFLSLFWQERNATADYLLRHAEATDDSLLRTRLVLRETVVLMSGDGSTAVSTTAELGRQWMLRQATSTGVIEATLSQLEHALASQFVGGCVAAVAIERTISSVAGAQANSRLIVLCLRTVRQLLKSRCLIAAPRSRWEELIHRRTIQRLSRAIGT